MSLDEPWWAGIHDFDRLATAACARLESFGGSALLVGVVDQVGDPHFVATEPGLPDGVRARLDELLRTQSTDGTDMLRTGTDGTWMVAALGLRGRPVGAAAWRVPDDAQARASLDALRGELALAVDVVAARYGRRRLRIGLAAVRRVSASLSGALTDADIATNAAKEALTALNAVACGIYRLRGDRLELVDPPAGEPMLPDTVSLDSVSPISDCVRNGEVIASAMQRGGDMSHRVLTPGGVPDAWLALPLLVDDRPTGALAIGFDRPRTFTPDELALAATIADQSAQALERTRLQTELERVRVEQSERRFRAALDAMVDLVTIETAVRDDAGAIVDFRIDFMNQAQLEVGGELVAHLTGRTVLTAYPALRDSELFAGYVRVAETGEPLVIDEFPFVDTIEGRAVSGHLSVQVSKFGDGIIVAARDVSRARLAEQSLQATTEQLAQEHASLLLLQEAMSPTLPDLDAVELYGIYEPAGEQARVGGDWFDALALDDGSVALIVGDIAGHGLPAAALMAQLRHALRAYLVEHMTPADALTALNRLARTGASRFQATCLAAIFDPESRRLVGASAGHLPYVVVRGGAARLEDVNVGVPIGVRESSHYGGFEAVLQPGDTVLLYTDGLVERRGEPIDNGFTRLLGAAARVAHASMPLEQVCRTIARDVTPPGPVLDDRCLLVLRLP